MSKEALNHFSSFLVLVVVASVTGFLCISMHHARIVDRIHFNMVVICESATNEDKPEDCDVWAKGWANELVTLK